MANIVPAQLTSAEGLFRDRLGLMPDKVKGVDPAKISNAKSLIRGRADFDTIPLAWRKLPECTDASYFAADCSLASTGTLDYPKATAVNNMFEGTTVNSFGSLSIPAATSVVRMFYKAFIGGFGTTVTTGPATSDYREACSQAVFPEMPKIPVFSDFTGATDTRYLFGQAQMDYLIGSVVAPGAAIQEMLGQAFSAPSTVKEVSGWKFSNVRSIGDQGPFPWSVSFPLLEVLDIEVSGSLECLYGTNGAAVTPSGNAAPMLSSVSTRMFDGLTSYDPNTANSNNNEELCNFSGSKLPVAMVDAVITSLDRAVTAGCTLVGGKIGIVNLQGANNAAPSAGVISGAIARLTAAGWTINTN